MFIVVTKASIPEQGQCMPIVLFVVPSTYSGNLKIPTHSKSRNIQNPDFLKIRFKMVRFSKGWALALSIAMVPTILRPDHLKSGHFCLDFKYF